MYKHKIEELRGAEPEKLSHNRYHCPGCGFWSYELAPFVWDETVHQVFCRNCASVPEEKRVTHWDIEHVFDEVSKTFTQYR